MNPDLVEAIETLRVRGTLSPEQAAALSPPARGELVSVHWELRTLLYAGVLLATGGVGLFLKENHERIGPTVLATLLGLAAAICLVYVWRCSPPFSWEATKAPHIAVDYVLLLGVLLLGSDLAYLETQFRWLGANWPLHLLIVSILYLAAAYRFDSRIVLSLALSTFAAWRGVSAGFSSAFSGRGLGAEAIVRANALACGVFFIALGYLSVRLHRKVHFEPVYVTGGLILLFGGLVSGAFESGAQGLPWVPALLVCAGATLFIGWRLRRTLDFAIGVLAAYLGLIRVISHVLGGSCLSFTIALSSLAVLGLLIRAQRRMKAPA
ncbi:MAG TPA: DUF2157 domain-containing protein [Thermoanaerobaculia bacterium]